MKLLLLMLAFILSSCMAQITPVAKGKRILSMDVNESEDVLYDAGIDKVMALGIREVPLFLNWNMIEVNPLAYDATLL